MNRAGAPCKVRAGKEDGDDADGDAARVTFATFERRAREMFESIPPELRRGVEYVAVERRAVPHEELPDVYTLGECATGELDLGFDLPQAVRSGVHLYYGSFRELARIDPDFDWEHELWETITHEIRHHRESTAGEDALEDFDYAAEENFRRHEGLPFDPLFYRAGETVEEGAWEVDGDLFIERMMDEDELAASPAIAVTVRGETVRVPAPDRLGDVHFIYLHGLPGDADHDVALVLVRRRGAWESLRRLFRGARDAEVIESRAAV